MRIALSLLFSFVFSSIIGQHLLSGNILGEQSEILAGATVVLLEAKDSSMVAFSISDDSGKFLLEDVPSGAYVLQLTYLSYASQNNSIEVLDGIKKQDLGSFQMVPSEETLQVVEVKSEHIPMGLMGDTISYNAAAFKTRPGATVEDLLKKLPGVEVERDGSIKAFGEEVENVLVDGKEFFGDDPKMATKNLEAEAVDKVQVFDKKSEIAEFTGIDDGAEEKTINLQLKEEYKRGGFGNVDLKGGTDNRYHGKINYNRFTPNLQAAVLANANNINQQAFSFNEYIQFMGGINNAFSGGQSFLQFGEFGQGSTPKGITDAFSSGVNLNYDFSSKLKLRSHYFYLRSDRNLDQFTTSNQFSDANQFISEEDFIAKQLNQNHQAQVKLDFKPNPFLQLLWTNTGSNILNDNNSMSATDFFTNGSPINFTTSDLSTANDQRGIDGNLQIRKKFKKKGRNWLNRINYTLGDFNETQRLENLFSDLSPEEESISQLQNHIINQQKVGFRSVYTEPIAKATYLSANYQYSFEQEQPEKAFYDITDTQQELNQELSGSYQKTNNIQTVGLSIRRNSKKIKLNAGVNYQYSKILGEIPVLSEPINTTNQFILPSFVLDSDLNNKVSLHFGYRTQVNLPTLSQLAPLPENSNPNLLIQGNPELKPEYVHALSLRYNFFDQFNFTNLFLTASANWTHNWINNQLNINERFLKVYRPINIDQHFRLSGNVNYSSPIRPLKIKVRAGLTFSRSNFNGLINDLQSPIVEQSLMPSFAIENRKKTKFDVSAGIRFNLTWRDFENSPSFNQQFFNNKYFIEGDWYLTDTWTLSSSFDFINYSSEFFSSGDRYNLWTASLTKTFKENKWAISLEVYDILNQNIGLLRSGGLNGLYEERFNILTQYVLLGVSYKLGRRPEKKEMF